jgi:splicing factor 3A subunit 1
MFVARNGRQWMTKLAQREMANAQFQFLNTTHSFHNFFQRLVDQYSALIRANGVGGEGTKLKEETVAALEHNVEDRFHVLARARQRAEYARYEAEERQKKEEEEAKKRQDFANTDWGDFVVVETITFTPSDATANLPPPTTLSDLQYASLEERNKVSINPNLRIEEAMPTDEPEPSPASFPLPVHTAYAPQHAPPGPQGPQQPYYPQQPVPSHPAPPAHHMSAQQEEEERRIQERMEARDRAHQARAGALGGPPIKIRENYVPRAAQRGAKQSNAMCPNCKQMVPMDEMEEHMRSKFQTPGPPALLTVY